MRDEYTIKMGDDRHKLVRIKDEALNKLGYRWWCEQCRCSYSQQFLHKER